MFVFYFFLDNKNKTMSRHKKKIILCFEIIFDKKHFPLFKFSDSFVKRFYNKKFKNLHAYTQFDVNKQT